MRSTAARHDSIRGIAGCYQLTLSAARWAKPLNMPLQINTLVTAETAPDLPALYELLKPFHIMRWSLFFLISVGRGRVLQPLTPAGAEDLMCWAYDLSRVAPFAIATTEAPSYTPSGIVAIFARIWRAERARSSPIALFTVSSP